jgi:hypothetical protein
MNRYLGAAASLVVGVGLTLTVYWSRTGESSAQVASQRALIAWLIYRDGAVPPAGQCRDVEVSLDQDDTGDAAPRRQQSAWTVCGLVEATLPAWEPGDGGLRARVDLGDKCRRTSRDLCTDDAGQLAHRCSQEAEAECLSAVRQSGGVNWQGPLRPAQAGDTDLKRLARRGLMAQNCGCANRRDAGVCRERIPQADAGPYTRLLAPGEHCGLGLCQGPGCEAAPCVESEAREACGGPGCLDPVECR